LAALKTRYKRTSKEETIQDSGQLYTYEADPVEYMKARK
jgi:hypothetical protein